MKTPVALFLFLGAFPAAAQDLQKTAEKHAYAQFRFAYDAAVIARAKIRSIAKYTDYCPQRPNACLSREEYRVFNEQGCELSYVRYRPGYDSAHTEHRYDSFGRLVEKTEFGLRNRKSAISTWSYAETGGLQQFTRQELTDHITTESGASSFPEIVKTVYTEDYRYAPETGNVVVEREMYHDRRGPLLYRLLLDTAARIMERRTEYWKGTEKNVTVECFDAAGKWLSTSDTNRRLSEPFETIVSADTFLLENGEMRIALVVKGILLGKDTEKRSTLLSRNGDTLRFERRRYDEREQLLSRYLNVYDADGRILETETFSSARMSAPCMTGLNCPPPTDRRTHEAYVFDEQGRLKTVFIGDGMFRARREYTCMNNGLPLTEESYDENNKLRSRIVHRYDPNGLLESVEVYDEKGALTQREYYLVTYD